MTASIIIPTPAKIQQIKKKQPTDTKSAVFYLGEVDVITFII